jgi:predicted Ser/Thr protein kinase
VPEELRDQLQTTLGAVYTLQRELGGGGMSRVFLARDATLERDVVVKVLSPDLAAERFTREIKLAARLQQANIVPLLSAGETDGLPYFIVTGSRVRVPAAQPAHRTRGDGTLHGERGRPRRETVKYGFTFHAPQR